MTGRGPRKADCHEVLEEVYLYLDLECDEDRRGLIQSHLDECRPCLREFGIEQEVKALVARCCGGETAPTELRESLRTKIQGLGTALSFEAELRDRG